MKSQPVDEKLIKRYLLGSASDEEQRRVEERLMEDSDYYTRILMMEAELADEYVRGQLSTAEQKLFLKNFAAAPERRQQVEFALALREHLLAAEEAKAQALKRRPFASRWQAAVGWLGLQSPFRALAVTFSALLVVIACGWLIVKVWQRQPPRDEANRGLSSQQNPGPAASPTVSIETKQEPQQQEARQTEKELTQPAVPQPGNNREAATARNRKPAAPPAPVIYSAALQPGLVRGDGTMKKLEVPAGTDLLELRLALPQSEYTSYRAVLQSVEGVEVASFERLRALETAGGTTILIRLPVKKLSDNDYALRLSGRSAQGQLESVNTYYFRLTRR